MIKKSPILTKKNHYVLSAPTTVHIELTTKCTFNCRHCYNFWRHEDTKDISMNKSDLDFIINELIKNQVFHVIFTGGEPFLNFELLEYGIKKVKENGLSVSCNSNLLLATPDKIKRLRNAGLPHILTSLNSYDKETNDYMISTPGAYERLIENIKMTIENGIRVSANMIITQKNKEQIYETAKLAKSLGVTKFHVTRIVPIITQDLSAQKEFLLSENEILQVIKDTLRVNKEIGIDVGTLIPYPYCFIGENLDVNVNEVFYHSKTSSWGKMYTHGCPAGNKMISINANGETHACVHEEESYGNIYKMGLKKVWKNMHAWRSDLFPEDCKACDYFDNCNAGCRIISHTCFKSLKDDDSLKTGWKNRKKKPPLIKMQGENFIVPSHVRFRKEKDFYAVSIFGANVVIVEEKLGKYLQDHQQTQTVLKKEHFIEFGLNNSTLNKLYETALIERIG